MILTFNTGEYRPFSLVEILNIMKNRKGGIIDHHGRENN